MLIVEYDHRSMKLIIPANVTNAPFKEFVELIKSTIPQTERKYNPDNRCWFMKQEDIKKLKSMSRFLDISWEKRL